jgi:hypothetical protein
MWQILRNRYWRMALASGLLAALIASLLVVAPLRTAGVQFLDIFRGWESADYAGCIIS